MCVSLVDSHLSVPPSLSLSLARAGIPPSPPSPPSLWLSRHHHPGAGPSSTSSTSSPPHSAISAVTAPGWSASSPRAEWLSRSGEIPQILLSFCPPTCCDPAWLGGLEVFAGSVRSPLSRCPPARGSTPASAHPISCDPALSARGDRRRPLLLLYRESRAPVRPSPPSHPAPSLPRDVWPHREGSSLAVVDRGAAAGHYS